MGLIDRWLKLLRDPAQAALPTARDEHRGMLRVLSGNGSSTKDELYFGRNDAGTNEWVRIGHSDDLSAKVDDTGDSITGAYTITNALTSAALTVDQNGATSASTSVGGAILLENTGNTGAGLVIYSNAGGTATGRLMNIRADNAAFPQAALHVDYDGTANAVEIVNSGTDSSSQALNLVSTNPNDTTLGINGSELSKGTVKIVHTGSASGLDGSASAISIDLQTAGTAAQGIYVDAASGTTGNLLRLRNSGADKFVVNKDGNVTTVGTVDGRDVSTDGATLDAHTAATAAHGATGAVVGTTNTQTLTNKTLTAPTLNDAILGNAIETTGTTPGVTALAAAGSTATVSVTGNDTCGIVEVVPGGAGIVAGAVITLTFAAARPDVNFAVLLTPASTAARSLSPSPGVTSRTTTTFNIATQTALTSGSSYQWFYFCCEY